MAANSWSPDPAGLQELLGCFKQAEVGDSATQRAVLQVRLRLVLLCTVLAGMSVDTFC